MIIEDRTFMARVCENTAMYEDMMIYIRAILETKIDDFTVE